MKACMTGLYIQNEYYRLAQEFPEQTLVGGDLAILTQRLQEQPQSLTDRSVGWISTILFYLYWITVLLSPCTGLSSAHSLGPCERAWAPYLLPNTFFPPIILISHSKAQIELIFTLRHGLCHSFSSFFGFQHLLQHDGLRKIRPDLSRILIYVNSDVQ